MPSSLISLAPQDLMLNKEEKMKASQIILTFGLTTMLSACYIERDVDTTPPHHTSVKRSTLSLHIPFEAHHTGLSHQEAAQLKTYINRASRPGPVYARLVVRKLHTRFDDDMTDTRIQTVVRFLKQAGVASHRIEVIEEGSIKPDKTETESGMWVGIDQYVTLFPECPGFDGQVMDGKVPPEGENHFGCSNEYNFARMLAEPRDIYKGHKLSPSDPVVNSNAIERLRTDKAKALKIEKVDTTSGASGASQ